MTVQFFHDLEKTQTDLLKQIQAERQRRRVWASRNTGPGMTFQFTIQQVDTRPETIEFVVLPGANLSYAVPE